MGEKIHGSQNKVYTAIGLMSGTSLDGIDAALLRTDGYEMVEPMGGICPEYDPAFKERLRSLLGTREHTNESREIENKLTLFHRDAVQALLRKYKIEANDIDVIGFHGHTINHDPDHRFTWQIGDGDLLAKETSIPVVNDFRTADVDAGGQGAPLLPLYHKTLAKNKIQPVSFLNIGGVGNITHIDKQDNIIAFDTGPGNALLNDFIQNKTGRNYDRNGEISSQGSANKEIIEAFLDHPYFNQSAPKSLDRNAWNIEGLDKLTTEDGAATLCECTIQSIAKGFDLLPQKPEAVFVCGGGRHNDFMMHRLSKTLPCALKKIEEIGHDGDMIEAEGFAYFAVRHMLGEPITYPEITGAPKPICTGTFYTTK